MSVIAWQLVATILVQLIVAGFVYGMLTQRVKDQGGWLKRHDSEIDGLRDGFVNHEGRISHLEGRKGLPHGGA